MFSIVQELMKTRRELREVKEQLRALQLSETKALSSNGNIPIEAISLFVQYNGFFNQLCDIPQTMTVGELLAKLRQLTGIPFDRPIHIRVLSEDGLTTVFVLHKELNRTLQSYNDFLKARMILSIEDNDQEKHLERSSSTTSSERTYSFDESDV
ncbi:unnamed protein product [Rotaria sp. Silwood2]|nr:unnamed protein product [Rotaria sp. Silwood2]CAF2522943.1 unnamed protein product [Rotaria sp. Silwood2]CAF2767521.1 unnamed protein product [Rotaria sp. Silwood2]CAF3901716.1 unnamed protein product [Rotaria sp. Silwood2]CAF3907171.1 unnamed protein product [Rotaria sp. Silwood2]